MSDTTAPPLLATRDALVRVLAAHVLYGDPDNGDSDYECGCGAKPPADAWEEDFGEERWHRAHLADALVGVVRDPATCARPAGSVLSACDECHGGAATHIRGDLTVCAACARKWPADVSARGGGWVRCYCGYDRLRSDECGEPCL